MTAGRSARRRATHWRIFLGYVNIGKLPKRRDEDPMNAKTRRFSSRAVAIMMAGTLIMMASLVACGTGPATQPPTQAPTQPPTEVPTQSPTQAPTQPPTQPPTQAPTQPPTQPPTDVPTQPPTQAPTQPPTQPPTQVPTQAPSPTTAISTATSAGAPALDGANLLDTRCATCHNLNRVKSAHKTRDQWDQTVTDMIRRGAQLTDAEKAALVDYLAKTYGP
jgi:outer membrane biosynthesis protein TonB